MDWFRFGFIAVAVLSALAMGGVVVADCLFAEWLGTGEETENGS